MVRQYRSLSRECLPFISASLNTDSMLDWLSELRSCIVFEWQHPRMHGVTAFVFDILVTDSLACRHSSFSLLQNHHNGASQCALFRRGWSSSLHPRLNGVTAFVFNTVVTESVACRHSFRALSQSHHHSACRRFLSREGALSVPPCQPCGPALGLLLASSWLTLPGSLGSLLVCDRDTSSWNMQVSCHLIICFLVPSHSMFLLRRVPSLHASLWLQHVDYYRILTSLSQQPCLASSYKSHWSQHVDLLWAFRLFQPAGASCIIAQEPLVTAC